MPSVTRHGTACSLTALLVTALAAQVTAQSAAPPPAAKTRANPQVTVQVKSRIRPMTAQVADPGERARLWPRLVDMYADFDNYQAWTDRTIPVVVCTPR